MRIKSTSFIVVEDELEVNGTQIYGVFQISDSKRSRFNNCNYFAKYKVVEKGAGIRPLTSSGSAKTQFTWDLKFYFNCDDIQKWDWIKKGDVLYIEQPILKKKQVTSKKGVKYLDVHLETNYNGIQRIK